MRWHSYAVTFTYSAKDFEVWASEKIALRKLGGGM